MAGILRDHVRVMDSSILLGQSVAKEGILRDHVRVKVNLIRPGNKVVKGKALTLRDRWVDPEPT